MTIQLRGLHPGLRPNADVALQLANQYGLTPTVTSVLRDLPTQQKLFDNFNRCVQSGLYPSAHSFAAGYSCKYPANAPGDSAHNYGLAWDSWVPDDQMPLWKAIREYCGFRVPDNDLVHAELPNWRDYIS